MCQALETMNQTKPCPLGAHTYGEVNITHRITYQCIIKTVKESSLKKKYLVGGTDVD